MRPSCHCAMVKLLGGFQIEINTKITYFIISLSYFHNIKNHLPIYAFRCFFSGFPHAYTLFRTICIGISHLDHPGWHQKHEYQGLIQPHFHADLVGPRTSFFMLRPLIRRLNSSKSIDWWAYWRSNFTWKCMYLFYKSVYSGS